MRLPRLNHLTGFRWWRHMKPRDDSPEIMVRQNAEISRRLLSPTPCAIGKIGTTELLGLEYFHRWIRPPWPATASWRRPARRLYDCSGVFPVRKDVFYRWAEEYRKSLAALDVVAQWQPGNTFEGILESKIIQSFCPNAFRAGTSLLRILTPKAPWLDQLAGMKWLIVHPFEKTIRSQLPQLCKQGVFSESVKKDLENRSYDARIIPCPQFAYMVPPVHRDWFQTLDEIKLAMAKLDFDILLVGAGAWSLPLAAHAKSLGRKAIHLGGALQLLFGIKGGRFDTQGVYNENWIRPLPEEIPTHFFKMENGAYW